MSNENLQPLAPDEAVEWYLKEKAQECAEATVTAHKYRLKHFVRWCTANNIENLNAVNGRLLQRYKTWRRDDGDLNNVTLHTQMTTLRVFLLWCEQIDAVPMETSEKVVVPSLQAHEDERERKIDATEAFDVLDYLRSYEYASNYHVAFELMWHTAARVGEIRALDIHDYNKTEAYLSIKHRPEGGTPLKNNRSGERLVAINDEIVALLDDWLSDQRHTVTDENGREPLLTTENGRPHTGTLRKWTYRVTERTGTRYNPHAIRRGSLTYHLLRDWSKEQVGERANVTEQVLDKHYDQRTDKEKLDQRRSNVTNL